MFLKKIFKELVSFFPKEKDRLKNVENLEKSALITNEKLTNSAFFKSLSKENQIEILKKNFSDDIQDVLQKHKKIGNELNKNWKEIVFHFFGMNENWPIGRCLLGALLVHLPEYPTYLIPAFMDAKATGSAKEIKKGEGPRGLLTGGLEGIAVGALVSGERLKAREMVPYIFLGAGLQFFSSLVFPWIGEKIGQSQYKKNSAQKINDVKLKPSNKNLYQNTYNKTSMNSGLKI